MIAIRYFFPIDERKNWASHPPRAGGVGLGMAWGAAGEGGKDAPVDGGRLDVCITKRASPGGSADRGPSGRQRAGHSGRAARVCCGGAL